MQANPPRPPFHFLRALALATVILALGAGAHVAGGGALPAPPIMLAVFALTALGSTTATRLRLGFPALAALLGTAQLALHEVFAAFSAPAGAAASGTTTAHDSHLADPGILALASDHLSGAGATSSPLMVAAHILATLASALLLSKGEAALWALAAWLRPLIRLPQQAKCDDGAPPLVTFPPAAVPCPPWRNLRQDSRRGPPSAVVLSS